MRLTWIATVLMSKNTIVSMQQLIHDVIAFIVYYLELYNCTTTFPKDCKLYYSARVTHNLRHPYTIWMQQPERVNTLKLLIHYGMQQMCILYGMQQLCSRLITLVYVVPSQYQHPVSKCLCFLLYVLAYSSQHQRVTI